MTIARCLITGLLMLTFATMGGSSARAAFIFDFTAECDDCAAGEGLELSPGENLGDGLSETVFGQLILDSGSPLVKSLKKRKKLQKKFPNSFTYGGSSLLIPFSETFFDDREFGDPDLPDSDGITMSGLIALDGTILQDVVISSKFFTLNVATDGTWDLFHRAQITKPKKKLDEGFGGSFSAASTTVPAPGALLLLGFGLLAMGARRRSA